MLKLTRRQAGGHRRRLHPAAAHRQGSRDQLEIHQLTAGDASVHDPLHRSGGAGEAEIQRPVRDHRLPFRSTRHRPRHLHPGTDRRRADDGAVESAHRDRGAAGLAAKHAVRPEGLQCGLAGDGRQAGQAAARRSGEGGLSDHRQDPRQRLSPDDVLVEADQHGCGHAGLQIARTAEPADRLHLAGDRRRADVDEFLGALYRVADRRGGGPGRAAGLYPHQPAVRGPEVSLVDQPYLGRLVHADQSTRLLPSAEGHAGPGDGQLQPGRRRCAQRHGRIAGTDQGVPGREGHDRQHAARPRAIPPEAEGRRPLQGMEGKDGPRRLGACSRRSAAR